MLHRPRHPCRRDPDRGRHDVTEVKCPLCDAPLYVSDNLNGGLITININGHARPAHRACPIVDEA